MGTSKPLTIEFATENGAIDYKSLSTLLGKTFRILSSIDEVIGGGKKTISSWKILSMRMESPGFIKTAGWREEERMLLAEPTDRFLDAISLLDKRPERPSNFADDTLLDFKSIAALLDDDVTKLSFRSNGRHTQITQRISAHVDSIVQPAEYEDWAGVEGMLLDVILSGGSPRFKIFDEVTGKGLPCEFEPEMLDAVKHAHPARVSVYGRIRYNRAGDPISIAVQEIEILQEPKHDFHPVNITNGIDAGEYIRQLRDDE